MSDERLAHLHDVARLLWPDPLELRTGRQPSGVAADDGAVQREYLLLPSARRPRLLVPRERRPAASAVLRYGVGRDRSARWQATLLAAGLTTGLGPVLLRDRVRLVGPEGGAPSIESHLAEVLGADVRVSLYLGAARANRKPVLHVLDAAGRSMAWVKVGVDPLTCRLVRDEAAALTALADAGLRHVTVPRVLHSGRWNDLQLLVQSPLPVHPRRARPGWDRVVTAQAEVAGIGALPEQPLGTTPYWRDLHDRVEQLPDGPAAAELRDLTDRVAEVFGDVPVTVGAWHGDWTPWNTAADGDALLVWDWERFGSAVPTGYDTLHWRLQSGVVTALADPAASARRCGETAPKTLGSIGLTPRAARATAAGYLAELAVRYVTDRQAEAGARLGDVRTWLLPALASAVGAKDR